MFGEAIRVPRHNKSLQSWSEANREASVFRDNVVSSEPGIKGQLYGKSERLFISSLPASSYPGGIKKCNYFVAVCIVLAGEMAFGGIAKKIANPIFSARLAGTLIHVRPRQMR
jgi:hypothetical protein